MGMSTYDRIRALPLTIEAYTLAPLTEPVAGDMGQRVCSLITLKGKGLSGVGEDVTYLEDLQKAFVQRGPVLPLAGSYIFDEFSDHFSLLNWFPDAPKGLFHDSFTNYRAGRSKALLWTWRSSRIISTSQRYWAGSLNR